MELDLAGLIPQPLPDGAGAAEWTKTPCAATSAGCWATRA